MKYDMDSRIRDVYGHPVGKDIVNKLLLQLNIKRGLLDNPLAGSLKLSFLQRLLGSRMSPGFWEAILALLNQELGALSAIKPQKSVQKAWWKEAVFYQIYPRSFMDTNGDGIGDIPGITSKLDYLKELGVDAIWLCPIYDSPQDDNGYDIRNYQSIDPTYGTMEDFNELLLEVHKRNMYLIMDLVVNHTSDEHEWFQKAAADPASKYRNYYYIRKGNGDTPPNNWTSFFSGSAWKRLNEEDWALKLFSDKQMDLNWENPALREEIYAMVRWWLNKGVDGFRLDVINYISKSPALLQGDELISSLMGFRGIEHYFHGPRLHEFLREMHEKAFAPFHAFSVGETPGIGLETGKLMTAPQRKELDMMFSFDHLENPGKVRFDEYIYDPAYLKQYYSQWMNYFSSVSQMSLFYDNHDNPRMLSKIDPDGSYRDVLAKQLAILQLTLKGTPFLFQGQELGAVNVDFKNIDELRDVESLNLYQELKGTMSEEALFQKILGGTRDHARVPMKWDSSENCGFCVGTPWIKAYPDAYNVEDEKNNAQSIYHFYKKLIRLRREHTELIYGDFEEANTSREIFAYTRGGKFRIILNLSSKEREVKHALTTGEIVISNYDNKNTRFLPYEGRIYVYR